MKLTTFIMIIALAQVSAKGLAQKITLNVSNTPIEKVLQSIRQQSGYEFIYNVNDLKGQKISLNIRNVSVEDAVAASIKNLDLDYKIREQNIVLTKKEKGFLDNIIARFQSIDVRGKVVDSLGNGLAGATVSVKGGKQSTQTAANGDFYLKNVEEGAVLVISYLGYVTKEQSASKELNYIQLQLSTSKLDEVQVIAYGTTSRRLSTGNITTITADEITKQPIDNPLLALQGRVPNLQVIPSSGLPGAQVKIQLRGQNSFGGNFLGPALRSEPLIVIDGIPVTNNIESGPFQTDYNSGQLSTLSFLNPSDIESIDVLADGDATSIFGSRGASGVIMITTKKGKVGKANLNFSVTTGFSEVNKRISLLTTEDYLQMRREAFKNDGLTVPSLLTPKAQRTGANYDLTVWNPNRFTDWQKIFIGGSAKQNLFQASMSGGNELVQYLINGNFNYQGYLFPGEGKMQSGSGNFSLSGRSADNRINISTSVSYNANRSRNPGSGFVTLAMGLAPNAPSLFDDQGKLNWAPDPESGVSTWNNPYARLLNVSTVDSENFRISGSLEYKLLDGLSLSTLFGLSKFDSKTFNPSTIEAQDPNLTNITGASVHSNVLSNSFTVDPQLKYFGKFAVGKLEALLGGNWQGVKNGYETVIASGYVGDAYLKTLSRAPTGGISGFTTNNQYRSISAFTRINYTIADKYIANFSGRRDGSSRFGPKSRYTNYWSIAGAWVFSSERFINKKMSFLSYGKLRASYGSNGNDAIGDYQYLELFESLPSDETYQNIMPIKSNGVVNPFYAWEKVYKAEVALETGYLQDKILLSVAYFQNRSDNQLGLYQLPATAGAYSIVINQPAKIQNMGWEIMLSTKNIKNKHFDWLTSLNIGTRRNRLLALPEGFVSIPYALSFYTIKGQSPIGKSFDGLTPAYEYKGVNSQTGVYQFSDQNGNLASSISTADQYAKLINIAPKYSGGLSNTFRYKNVSLDIFVQFSKQLGTNYMFDEVFAAPGATFSRGIGANRPIEVMSRWKAQGDNSSVQKFTTRFSSQAGNAYNAVINSDLSIVDASFLKLKNVALSYTIPNAWRQKLNLKSAAFTIRGSNLLTITNYEGFDPEIQSMAALPQLRSITAGFQVGF